MSYLFEKKPKTKKKLLSSFEGIAEQEISNDLALTMLENFRPYKGHLKTREGSEQLYSFPSIVRGFFEGEVFNASEVFCVVGSSVYRKSGTVWTNVFSLTSSTGEAHFYKIFNTLLLCDGKKIYSFNGVNFSELFGYAPLIGKNWHPTNGGTFYEAVSLLTNKVRLHFLTNGMTSFTLPYYPTSVDKVLLDGSVSASFTLSGNILSVPSASSYTEMEVGFEVSLYDDLKSKLAKSLGLSLVYNGSNTNLFFYAMATGDVAKGEVISESTNNESKLFYPSCLPFYLPVSDFFPLSSEAEPILAGVSYYNEMLFFTKKQTFLFQPESNLYFPLLDGIGVNRLSAVCTFANKICLVTSNGLVLGLSATASHPERVEIVNLKKDLTLPIEENAFLFAHPTKNELWVCYPTSQKVAVYSGKWFFFVGLTFDTIQPFGDMIYLFNSSAVAKMSESAVTDKGSAISCKLISSALLEFPKTRVCEVFADIKGKGSYTLKAKSEHVEKSKTATFLLSAFHQIRLRSAPSRHKYLCITLTASEPCEVLLLSILQK